MRQVYGRAGRTLRIVRDEGPRALARRVARAGYHRLGAAELEFPLFPEDVTDSGAVRHVLPDRRPRRGEPLTIGWVSTPPAPGSGGHTTFFRMVEALEAAGHRCVLHLYDRYGGDVRAHERVVRAHWPGMRAEVRDATAPWAPMDAGVATSWPTAHVVAARGTLPMRRLYFVQDYEPYFYPHGSEYALAEDTYRFGFRCISVGRMVARILREDHGVDADVAEFGLDTDVYALRGTGPRDGVVFYARPGVARRGFALGMLALAEFHRRHPEHEIHLFGDEGADVRFPATRHGRLRPAELAGLYNRCVAGIAMSFTNISLVPEEMLACGVIPVLNDFAPARAELDSPHARWARPTPGGFADVLSEIVTADDVPARAAAAAAGVRGGGWKPAQAATVAAIENEVYGC
jgi:hypothetical protein